ncbi:MAG: CHAT domain-containing protein, partial [bacterium]|nr:CHAT domain-containing protein [bacterium]
CWQLGEPEWALDHLRRALLLRRQLGDPSMEALTANDLGLVHSRLGEAQEALDFYNRALALRRRTGERFQEATALHNRGKVYLLLGRGDQALDDFSQALAIRREIDDQNGQASTLTAIGEVYRKSEAMEKALGFFQEALELRKRVEDLSGQAVTLTSMGMVYDSRDEKEKALTAYEETLSIFRQEGRRRDEANVHHDIGVVLTSSHQPEEALEQYLQALPVFEEFGDQAGVAETLVGMAYAERKRGELPEARDCIERALERIEDLRTKPASPDLRSTYLATKQKYYDLYIDILMELHRLQPSAGHDVVALAVSERARARSLLEILIESRASPRGDAEPELIEREQQLGRRIHAKVLRRMELLEDALSTAVVERELRDLTGQLRELRGQIRLRSPRYAALTQPQPLSAGQIQRRVLDEETLLLEYQLGEDRSFLWAVTPDSIASFELPPQAEIERVARRTYDLLVISNRRRYRVRTERTLATLSKMLLGPVVEHLGSKRLLIVAEGALQYIPFGALPVPDRSGAASEAAFESSAHAVPLIVEHEIVSVPSASALDVLRRQVTGRRPAPGVVAVLADPVFRSDDPRVRENRTTTGPHSSRAGPGKRGEPPLADPSRYERLGYSRQEAEAILDLVPAEGSFEALDFKASLETATRGDLGRYRIVHFATHGEFDTAQPELSRLVLSLVDDQGRPQDGLLFAHQIYNLELPAELVVLSSCHSALGTEIRGEGLVGLTQGFMYAGAARVVVSLWNVDDQATAALMKRFYQHLLEDGLRPAAALRKAQIAIGRELPWQAPYFWAGFVLQGEWR